MIRIQTSFNENSLVSNYKVRLRRAQFLLDMTILNDSEPYVPMETGELVRSASRASKLGKGQIIYDTPYARKVYWMPETAQIQNRNTRPHPLQEYRWFETVKPKFVEKWQKVVNKALLEG